MLVELYFCSFSGAITSDSTVPGSMTHKRERYLLPTHTLHRSYRLLPQLFLLLFFCLIVCLPFFLFCSSNRFSSVSSLAGTVSRLQTGSTRELNFEFTCLVQLLFLLFWVMLLIIAFELHHFNCTTFQVFYLSVVLSDDHLEP